MNSSYICFANPLLFPIHSVPFVQNSYTYRGCAPFLPRFEGVELRQRHHFQSGSCYYFIEGLLNFINGLWINFDFNRKRNHNNRYHQTRRDQHICLKKYSGKSLNKNAGRSLSRFGRVRNAGFFAVASWAFSLSNMISNLSLNKRIRAS